MPRRLLIALAALILVPVALLAAAIVVVQSEWAERWVERRIADRIGREVEIEGVDFYLGWPPGINLERLRIGNPEWAKTADLIDAQGLRARRAASSLRAQARHAVPVRPEGHRGTGDRR